VKLNPNHPALSEARTIHPKRVFDPAEYKDSILKSVADNKKLGNGSNRITKGRWNGFPMFSLTLEERATCPSSCHHWRDCYGNGMAFGHRFKAGESLEKRLESELSLLANSHKRGFVVRLHVLGDFYSVEYVEFWQRMLVEFPNLRIFGYTARYKDPIGYNLAFLNAWFPDRCWIRFSQKESELGMAAIEVPNAKSITCPEQTNKTEACITCGLCWSVKKPIHFLTH
jgi:hypothetical protein